MRIQLLNIVNNQSIAGTGVLRRSLFPVLFQGHFDWSRFTGLEWFLRYSPDMQAIISDIHSNLEALCEVLKDIDGQSVDEIVCLGDVVGYGPDPEPCVDFIMERTAFCLKGNHDYALLNSPLGFNPLAAEIILKTREIMEPDETDYTQPPDGSQRVRCSLHETDAKLRCLFMEHGVPDRWHFLENLPEIRVRGKASYVHGSPLDPVFEYVFPDKMRFAWKPARLKEMFETVESTVFCGHTHHPCAIDSNLNCFYPTDRAAEMVLSPEKKYIVNAGSVGQPRDGDNRACYLLYDSEKGRITWRRVAYDFDLTATKIEAMCGRPNFCATRLKSGR